MKIINELSYSQINNNKKDTLATRLSIFLAVVLLGTIIFIIGTVKLEQHREMVSMIGDYQVSFSEVNSNMLDSLLNNDEIKKVSFDKFISTDLNAIIIEKGSYFRNLKGFEIISGKNISSGNELIAPSRFFEKNKEYKIGSKIKVKEKEYTIVGEYNDYATSFEETALIGILENENKEYLLQNSDGIEVFIWYKQPRDTYTLTKKLFDTLEIDYAKSIDTGRLYFNKEILEYQMIYPSGLIPPKSVIADWLESYGACILLVILFSVMIYGAFNVWNNRDIKELALLKSVGMTEKQIKKMIRLKAIKIGVVPILSGTAVSYLTANLLFYLMWLNNSITYKNMSKLFGEKMRGTGFHIVPFSVPLVVIILAFAFLTVYLSAIVPAKKSAKLNVVEGLTGITGRKVKFGKSKIAGKIEKTLAKDYFKAYNLTYRTIILEILLSAMVMTLTLVSQSYRTVNAIYDKYDSPYNFTSKIYTDKMINKQLIDDLNRVDDIEELHIYGEKSFKFYLKDNEGFESEELKKAFKTGGKDSDNLFVKIIGLSEKDYKNVISINQFNTDTNYILLNKTTDSDSSPYAFRKYISLTESDDIDLVLRYNAEGKQMPIHIDGYINELPFGLEEQNKNGVYVFTRMEKLENFIDKYGQDEGDPVNYYNVKMKISKENLDKISDKCERIISSYVPQSDHSTTNDLLKKAADNEQLRNEHLLNFGIQIILIILALSNAYNSFHGNLRARKREFQLLSTVGMTEKQIKKMIFGESKILFRYSAIFYIGIFILSIFVRSYKSQYEFAFISKEILLNLNYVPIILIFGVIVLGVLLSINSSIKKILGDDLNGTIKEI